MFKKFIVTFLMLFILNTSVYAAGSGGEENDSKIKLSNYKKANSMIKAAKKLEKKGKPEKAKVKYLKAIDYLVEANYQKPNNPDILNYLGYSHRKIGDFENAEVYYKLGLDINPNHVGINEYLGELYVQTGRIEEAKMRLKVLENCKCEEFEELKNVINSGKSKY
jgi:tetratricopeptide (TPR) repeat protein